MRLMDCCWGLCDVVLVLYFVVFEEVIDVVVVDDYVIQDDYVEYGQCMVQFVGEDDVGFVGLWVVGRVVVCQDYCGCIVMQCVFGDFVWVDVGFCQCVVEEFFLGNELVLYIQKEVGEYFVWVVF